MTDRDDRGAEEGKPWSGSTGKEERMSRNLILLGLAVVLAGCAPKWHRADATPQQLAKDDYECIQKTRDQQPMNIPSVPTDQYHSGSYTDPNPVSSSMTHTRSLYRACMRARGYQEQ